MNETLTLEEQVKKITAILSTGPASIEVAQTYIARNNLPLRIDVLVEGEKAGYGIVKSVLSRGEQELAKFITQNEDMLFMKADAKTISETPYEVLISGPTGTGKELIARSQIGKRTGAICAVNCAGFPEHLFESELFGHVKGAFTGADASREGLLQVAKGGIIFLDEIQELPLHLQAKLLRAIQDKRIRAVGGKSEVEIDCKFVCATNKDLKACVEAGIFREDLYARISTFELKTTGLKDRREDILPILKSLPYGREFLEKYPAAAVPSLDVSHNVRSLQRHVTRMKVLGRID